MNVLGSSKAIIHLLMLQNYRNWGKKKLFRIINRKSRSTNEQSPCMWQNEEIGVFRDNNRSAEEYPVHFPGNSLIKIMTFSHSFTWPW